MQVTGKNVVCAVCGSSTSRFLFNGKSLVSGEGGNFRFVQCTKCGLIYLNPRPDPGFMERFYADELSFPGHGTGGDTVKKTGAAARRQRILNRMELNSMRASVKKIMKYKRLAPDSLVLDVGSLSGSFLRAVQMEAGCRVFGVDISSSAAEYVRTNYGIHVEHADFIESSYSPDSFDLITMWHVLEHSWNPKGMIEKAVKLLKNDGILVVEVPSLANWYWRILKGAWLGHFTPTHLYGFSPSNLTKLLEDNGFSPFFTRIKVHFPLFFISIFMKIFPRIDMVFLEKHPFLTLSLLGADLPVALVSAVTGKGGAVMIYARKKSMRGE